MNDKFDELAKGLAQSVARRGALKKFGLGLVALALPATISYAPSLCAAPAQQAYIKASNTEAGDWFGFSVAVSGNTMVIGAPFESSSATGVNGNQNNNNAASSGAAYVFVRNGATWSQQAYLKASNTGAGDLFGHSVAISSNTVVVGALFESSNATGVNGNQNDNSATNSGAAYVFVRNGTTWTQQAYLKASNTGAGDCFGYSVAISGDTVVIGAGGEDSSATGVNGNQNDNSAINSGAAYVFVRNGTTWSQQAYLKASNAAAGDFFGGLDYYFSPLAGVSGAVAISGDTIVVGATGKAYVFVRNGTTWSQQAYLNGSGGYSVAVSGDTVVIGATHESSSATGVNGDQNACCAFDSGAAYVFVRNGTNWSQQAYLKASYTESPPPFPQGPGDEFGQRVAVSGDTVVVGAPLEDSSATGVNGDQTNNNSGASGAAYVFVRKGTNWSQQAYLKASNTGSTDAFAVSVAVSGDTVVSGAFGEWSSATGVNGNQNDNSAAGSGAAYVFTGLGFGPTLALVQDGSGGYFLRFAGHAGFTYRLLRGPSVTGPWSAIATNTAPASGLVEFHERAPLAAQAFYRTAVP